MRLKLVWRVGAVVVAILTVAIALSGYANNLISAHYSLESARAFLRFNSESIIKGIGQLMMGRNNQGIERLIGEMSRESSVYGDIRLVSHHSGEIVASRFQEGPNTLEVRDRACALCHDREDLGGEAEMVDAITEGPEGDRILSVMAPILNADECRSAGCHAHTSGPPILGFLNADYSLQRVDAMATDRRLLITGTVLASLLLGVIALWVMFTRLLERPIGALIAGTERIAANHLDFRFAAQRRDEIGTLEASFNTMTAAIQEHQEELRNAKEYLEGMVERSGDIIMTVDVEGRIQTFNRGAEQALGYDRDEVMGQRIEILFADPKERDDVIARLELTDNVRNYEARFVAKDGEVRDVLLTLSRLRDPGGAPIGTFGISKDISQEKKLQRELVQSQKLAAIGEAVTGIQHAIKNMLNGLKGGAYLVQSGVGKSDVARIEEGWEMVQQGIERIDKLSHHMLDFAKEWKVEIQRVNLNEVVARVCEQYRQTAVDKGIDLQFEEVAGVNHVSCDPRLIHMAVTDIVDNAIGACTWKDYASDERPEVLVRNSLSDDGVEAVVEIRDNGCGMDEEIKTHIFTPFFSTKKTRGAGLGLALTARIIDAHDGRITVESDPDRGSTFCIHLPIDGPADRQETTDGQTGSSG